jgi:hypothetical protein
VYEAWIIISDVGAAPDYRGEWPKLAVAHVEYEHEFGDLCLGNPQFTIDRTGETGTTIIFSHTKEFRSVLCPIQYFNDAGDGGVTGLLNSRGTIAILDVQPLYGKVCPIQLVCDHITEAEFGTYIAFDTLPALQVLPK